MTAAEIGNGRRWAAYIISAIPVLFLILDAVGKFIKPEAVVTGTLELGYQETVIVPLGILLMVCTIIYAIPRTAIIGAILLTGYLGGTVATHVRIDNPLLTHTLFGVYLGVMLWLGLYLRDPTLQTLLPLVLRRS